MESLDYEIKFGKHIAFRHKDKQKFTRAKTIGEDYTEEKIKERIDLAIRNKTNTIKKRVGNVIDISTNEKAQLKVTKSGQENIISERWLIQ